MLKGWEKARMSMLKGRLNYLIDKRTEHKKSLIDLENEIDQTQKELDRLELRERVWSESRKTIGVQNE